MGLLNAARSATTVYPAVISNGSGPLELGTCTWIASHANVILTGATGTGKSYVACALAQQACRAGFRAAYRRMPRLLEELALAHADYVKRLALYRSGDGAMRRERGGIDPFGAVVSLSDTARSRPRAGPRLAP